MNLYFISYTDPDENDFDLFVRANDFEEAADFWHDHYEMGDLGFEEYELLSRAQFDNGDYQARLYRLADASGPAGVILWDKLPMRVIDGTGDV